MKRSTQLFLIALISLTTITQVTEAGIWNKVAIGLDWAGFSVTGERNPLSGGAEMSVSRFFQGTEFDMGFASMTLSGPVEFTFKTGDRFLDTLDVSLSTPGQALSYDLMIDVGGQKTTYTGSMFLDAGANVNEFGFYDLTFDYSMRQTVNQEGRFGDYEEFADTDIGPIDVSGNLFADMLGVLFDPVFDALGISNIFESFSGKYSAGVQLDDLIAAAQDKLEAGGTLNAKDISEIVAYSMTYETLGGEAPDLSFLEEAKMDTDSLENPLSTPEPAAMVLLAIGALAFFRPRRM